MSDSALKEEEGSTLMFRDIQVSNQWEIRGANGTDSIYFGNE